MVNKARILLKKDNLIYILSWHISKLFKQLNYCFPDYIVDLNYGALFKGSPDIYLLVWLFLLNSFHNPSLNRQVLLCLFQAWHDVLHFSATIRLQNFKNIYGGQLINEKTKTTTTKKKGLSAHNVTFLTFSSESTHLSKRFREKKNCDLPKMRFQNEIRKHSNLPPFWLIT